MKEFVCSICGYIYRGNTPPPECPRCEGPSVKFLERVNKNIMGNTNAPNSDVQNPTPRKVIDTQKNDGNNLIPCPACGNMVSEKANSCPNCGEPIALKQNSRILSGTESFIVQGKNRLELSALTQAEVDARSRRLSSEGKTVVNVNISTPQPLTLGVTIWKNDVIIIWNATYASIYDKAKSLMYVDDEEAAKLFGELGEIMLSIQCSSRIEERKKKEAAEKAQEINAIGKEPNVWLYLIAFLLIPIGAALVLIGIVEFANYEPESGLTMLILGIIMLICGPLCLKSLRKKDAEYSKKRSEYRLKSYKK